MEKLKRKGWGCRSCDLWPIGNTHFFFLSTFEPITSSAAECFLLITLTKPWMYSGQLPWHDCVAIKGWLLLFLYSSCSMCLSLSIILLKWWRFANICFPTYCLSTWDKTAEYSYSNPQKKDWTGTEKVKKSSKWVVVSCLCNVFTDFSNKTFVVLLPVRKMADLNLVINRNSGVTN